MPLANDGYDAEAPHPLLMKGLAHAIVVSKKRGALVLAAPAFARKLSLGEMSAKLPGSHH